jgi:hypothetical protein
MQSRFAAALRYHHVTYNAIPRTHEAHAYSHQGYSAPAGRNGGHLPPGISGRMTVIRKGIP